MIPQLKIRFLKPMIFAFITTISINCHSQTIPNMYPLQWLCRHFKKANPATYIVSDTTIKPLRKCVTADSCYQRHKGKADFVNNDSLLRKRVLKTWRY